MLKRELRKKYKDLRRELSLEEVSNLSITLANGILQIPIWDFFYFHIFLSINKQKEIDTQPILAILQGKDKNVLIPKVNGENTLENYLLLDNTVLKKNKWGIPEPVDGITIPNNKIDVVFLPLLAFDLRGNRVGYGKGYYDTFLNNCRKETVKIGVSLFEAETSINDTNEHDVTLDYCITPDRIYKF
ncbi:5-formyltetrahydrofolate cyclo-ligase [Flagellimonas sp. 389]|uniref:5-formyltetrahydrofolate cyclo-ligase n=1 Tax=Flagellimonas sp. 389 TaxID=2835862 RepID=UPI001BD49552|nr:5-formyltetrahydrofolate cyclo-ligase [Flagellimonas sp. 389]MBS9462536.1 5-formyltetrahydrofolate cyclo-ligase [Flagellimonas sp. 389]